METKRAGIYVRISRDSEGTGLGVARQESECRTLAAARGWTIVDVYRDNDISAFSGKRRPEYERLIADIEAGLIDAVLAWHPDRLTRQPRELETLIDILQAHIVDVATVAAGAYDLTTASGRTVARMVGVVARGESEQKSERLRSQRRQAAERGVRHGGPRPYGFDDDGVTHRPDEVARLREAVELILDGGSLSDAARVLGGRSRASVKRTLTAPRIAGLRQHRGEVIGTAEWEPVIDRATWERLRVVLSDPRRKTTQPARAYLLAGLVVATDFDGTIERRMISRPDDGRRFYITDQPKDRSVDADRLEALVVESMLAHYDAITVAPDPVEAEAEAAAADVAAIEAELAELAGLRGRGDITISEWMIARGPLQDRLEAARAAIPTRRVSKSASDLFAAPGELRRRWPSLTFQQRRVVVTAAITHVGVGPSTRGWRFDPTRVSIAWR